MKIEVQRLERKWSTEDTQIRANEWIIGVPEEKKQNNGTEIVVKCTIQESFQK